MKKSSGIVMALSLPIYLLGCDHTEDDGASNRPESSGKPAAALESKPSVGSTSPDDGDLEAAEEWVAPDKPPASVADMEAEMDGADGGMPNPEAGDPVAEVPSK